MPRDSNGEWIKGDWMQTYTGKKFYPLDPQPEDIDVCDIAHALAHQCRFAGHTQRFYSVAEHCVLISQKAPKGHKLAALMHDASEAYLVDIPRPLKPFLANYKEIEDHLMTVIATRYAFQYPLSPEVHELDLRILFDERKALLTAPPADWEREGAPMLGVRIMGFQPPVIESIFLDTFHRLVELEGGR